MVRKSAGLVIEVPGVKGLSFGVNYWEIRQTDVFASSGSISYGIRAGRDHWLDNTSIRLGVINLFDRIPPLSSDSRGYDPSLFNQMARGRSWSLQITKRL